MPLLEKMYTNLARLSFLGVTHNSFSHIGYDQGIRVHLLPNEARILDLGLISFQVMGQSSQIRINSSISFSYNAKSADFIRIEASNVQDDDLAKTIRDHAHIPPSSKLIFFLLSERVDFFQEYLRNYQGDRNALLNKFFNKQFTFLHIAISLQQLEIVKFLCELRVMPLSQFVAINPEAGQNTIYYGSHNISTLYGYPPGHQLISYDFFSLPLSYYPGYPGNGYSQSIQENFRAFPQEKTARIQSVKMISYIAFALIKKHSVAQNEELLELIIEELISHHAPQNPLSISFDNTNITAQKPQLAPCTIELSALHHGNMFARLMIRLEASGRLKAIASSMLTISDDEEKDLEIYREIGSVEFQTAIGRLGYKKSSYNEDYERYEESFEFFSYRWDITNKSYLEFMAFQTDDMYSLHKQTIAATATGDTCSLVKLLKSGNINFIKLITLYEYGTPDTPISNLFHLAVLRAQARVVKLFCLDKTNINMTFSYEKDLKSYSAITPLALVLITADIANLEPYNRMLDHLLAAGALWDYRLEIAILRYNPKAKANLTEKTITQTLFQMDTLNLLKPAIERLKARSRSDSSKSSIPSHAIAVKQIAEELAAIKADNTAVPESRLAAIESKLDLLLALLMPKENEVQQEFSGAYHAPRGRGRGRGRGNDHPHYTGNPATHFQNPRGRGAPAQRGDYYGPRGPNA